LRSKVLLSSADFLSVIREIWREESPLLKLFRTDRHGYDTGTNRILRLDEPEFLLLNQLVSSSLRGRIDLGDSGLSDGPLPKAIKDLSNVSNLKKVRRI